MIEEGITKIEELVGKALVPNKFEIEDRIYYDKQLIEFKPPMDHTAMVGTLTGFSDLVEANINGTPTESERYIHVLSPKKVTFAHIMCNQWGQRQVDILAELPNFGSFPFGEYMEQERFIIGLQAFFKPTDDIAFLQQIAGTLKAEQVHTSDDDGISQKVAIRTGVVLAENVVVKPLVKLSPWRTFREIEQPESTFIFRLRNVKDCAPLLSLHIADGEVWQNEAMQSIKTWLKEKHPDLAIVA